jgi:hypothetical protein
VSIPTQHSINRHASLAIPPKSQHPPARPRPGLPALPMAKHANLRTLWSGSRHSSISRSTTPDDASSP